MDPAPTTRLGGCPDLRPALDPVRAKARRISRPDTTTTVQTVIRSGSVRSRSLPPTTADGTR